MTYDPVLELAEHLNANIPLAPGDQRFVFDDAVVCLAAGGDHPALTVVQRLRLPDDDDAIAARVAAIRELLRAHGRTQASWELGPSASPGDLRARLLALGLTPYEEPTATAMVLRRPLTAAEGDTTRPPPPAAEGDTTRPLPPAAEGDTTRPPPPAAEGDTTRPPPPAAEGDTTRPPIAAHAADDVERAIQVSEVLNAVFRERSETPDERRARIAGTFDAYRASGRAAFLATLDGRAVAAAHAIYTPAAVVLCGGATLPEARGLGAYRALLAARYDEAVRRGTPTLVVQAGAMSRPILEGLGFEAVATIEILHDRFGARA